MKVLLRTIILLLLFANNLIANEIILEDHYKVLSTFSGDIEKKQSFHIIIAKNKNTGHIEIIPIAFFNNVLKKYSGIVTIFPETPSIESYHIVKDKKVSFLIMFGFKTPRKKCVVDIDFSSGEISPANFLPNQKLKSTLKLKNKQLVICKDLNDLYVYQISSSNSIIPFKLSKNNNNKAFFKGNSNNVFDPINTQEFVSNGSINDIKVYGDTLNNLYLTKDILKEKQTYVLTINLSKSIGEDINSTVKAFKFSDFKSFKGMCSYYHDNKLFQLLLSKDQGFIKINDLITGDVRSINITDHSDFIIASKGFKSLEVFLKNATKSKFKSTITVNEHRDNNHLVLRVDYVSAISYNYHFDWWWYHRRLFWPEQQIMNNLIRSFGPLNPLVDYYDVVTTEDDEHYFELVMDKKTLQLINKTTEYKFRDIDKIGISEQNQDKTYNYSSSVFLDNKFVQFYQDKKSKAFRIVSKPISND